MVEEASKFIEQAKQYDLENKAYAAIYYYGQAAEILLKGVKSNQIPSEYLSKAEDCIERAETLKISDIQLASKTEQQLDLERAEFLLKQALDEDEDLNYHDAIELYAEAVELCIKAKKTTKNVELQKKLTHVAKLSLERAEELKKKDTTLLVPQETLSARQDQVEPRKNLSLSNLNLNATAAEPSSSSGQTICGNNCYSREELEVLRVTSKINGREYVPFLSVDLKERFAYPVPFADKHGALALAVKQKEKFAKWMRPEEFVDQPCIIEKIDSGSIKQTLISDCSFIASLAVSARYERRFNKKLITNIIYPKNKNGDPTYNPCGKYMIRLNLNGVSRKVIVDDYFPIGRRGEILCSCSQRRNELWVSLLEKAYMKVMGGYDFPGSNSNIDLHALTGWIPDRIAIRPNCADFNKEKVFEKIFDRFHKGDCLVTVATGQLSQADQDRAGLVECHAYAMLDIRKVVGKPLFMLKNPWTHLRWKGNFSERDSNNWTKEMQAALDYNPSDAQQFDDGVFWIDYDSVCRFFDVFYINWNPALFKYTYATHGLWKAGAGPAKDLYSVAENPQFSLFLNSDTQSGAVWILLTRHITDKNDFADNKEYITLLVYKNDGKKVYYPFDPAPFIDGTRINSPHYLCKMVLKDKGATSYTLVISQFEKSTTIYYTIRVHSTVPFKLSKIEDNFKFTQKEVGEWKGRTAGGCCNNRETYVSNPIYQLALESYTDDNDLCIDLKGPKQYSVGFDFVQVNSKNNKTLERRTSGSYRPGFGVLRLEKVPAGNYNVIPTTFLPGQEGPFFLTVKSTCNLTIRRLQ